MTDIGQSEIEVRRLPDLPPGTEAQESRGHRSAPQQALTQ